MKICRTRKRPLKTRCKNQERTPRVYLNPPLSSEIPQVCLNVQRLSNSWWTAPATGANALGKSDPSCPSRLISLWKISSEIVPRDNQQLLTTDSWPSGVTACRLNGWRFLIASCRAFIDWPFSLSETREEEDVEEAASSENWTQVLAEVPKPWERNQSLSGIKSVCNDHSLPQALPWLQLHTQPSMVGFSVVSTPWISLYSHPFLSSSLCRSTWSSPYWAAHAWRSLRIRLAACADLVPPS